MSEKVISANGFWITISCPSESKLYVRLDITMLPREKREEFIEGLLSLLTEIDEKFAENPERLRGRASRRTDRILRIEGGKTFERSIRFSPFPSKISNAIKNLRRELYSRVLPRYTWKVQSIPTEWGYRNIYFLPQVNYDGFKKSIDKLNEEIEKLEDEAKEFIENEYYTKLIEFCESYVKGASGIFPSRIELRRVTFNPLPVVLSPEILDKALGEVWDKREKEMLAKLRDYIEEKRKELTKALIEEFRQRLMKTVVDLIADIRSARPETARHNLKILRKQIEEVGLSGAVGDILSGVDKIIDCIAEGKTENLADVVKDALKVETGDLKEALDIRIDSLLKYL